MVSHKRKRCRTTIRSVGRRPVRRLDRRSLRGRRRGPDDLAQALSAYGRALRAQRRLARLAPSFFDTAVKHREAENRAEIRRWLAMWEPFIAKAYGVDPQPPDTTDELPRLPSPRIQRAVDRKLAELQDSMAAAHFALERYRQRQPHALMSLCRMARLLEIAFAFKRLACGLDSPNPLPEKIVYDYELTNLKRGYGHLMKEPAVAVETSPRRAEFHAAPIEPAIVPAHPTPVAPIEPVPPRCDAWSRWARQLRKSARKC